MEGIIDRVIEVGDDLGITMTLSGYLCDARDFTVEIAGISVNADSLTGQFAAGTYSSALELSGVQVGVSTVTITLEDGNTISFEVTVQ